MKTQELPNDQGRLLMQLESCGLSKDAVAVFLRCYTLVRYPKGAPLFANGTSADLLLAVLSGLVKIYCRHTDGSRILMRLAGPGDFASYGDFCARPLVRSQSFEARALTSCRVAIFRRDRMVRELNGVEPMAIVRLTETISSMWLALVYRYVSFLRISLRERLEMVFGELAARFGVADARGVIVTPELCQEELAEMIGGSRPMVSRLLAEMTEQGVLAREGRRYIVLRSSRPERGRLDPVRPRPRVESPISASAGHLRQWPGQHDGIESGTDRVAMVTAARVQGMTVAGEDPPQPLNFAARKTVSAVLGSARS
jgi:CRP/FNR family transcriptional regulator, cyclic AMP receptor protein